MDLKKCSVHRNKGFKKGLENRIKVLYPVPGINELSTIMIPGQEVEDKEKKELIKKRQKKYVRFEP